MIVDPKTRIAFIHNPKAAGTSVRTLLLEKLEVPDFFRYQGFIYDDYRRSMQMHNMSHLDWNTFQKVLEADPKHWGDPKTYSYFGMVRDPYDRFLSAIREFRVKHEVWLSRFQGMSVVDFLKETLTPESIWLPEYSWFKPQYSFFPDPDSGYECTVFHTEDKEGFSNHWYYLFEEQVELPVLNKKSVDQDPDFEGRMQELRSMTYYLYAEDYERFPILQDSSREPVPFHNMDSYMWTVRAMQARKINPSASSGAVADDAYDPHIAAQILQTTPYTIEE